MQDGDSADPRRHRSELTRGLHFGTPLVPTLLPRHPSPLLATHSASTTLPVASWPYPSGHVRSPSGGAGVGADSRAFAPHTHSLSPSHTHTHSRTSSGEAHEASTPLNITQMTLETSQWGSDYAPSTAHTSIAASIPLATHAPIRPYNSLEALARATDMVTPLPVFADMHSNTHTTPDGSDPFDQALFASLHAPLTASIMAALDPPTTSPHISPLAHSPQLSHTNPFLVQETRLPAPTRIPFSHTRPLSSVNMATGTNVAYSNMQMADSLHPPHARVPLFTPLFSNSHQHPHPPMLFHGIQPNVLSHCSTLPSSFAPVDVQVPAHTSVPVEPVHVSTCPVDLRTALAPAQHSVDLPPAAPVHISVAPSTSVQASTVSSSSDFGTFCTLMTRLLTPSVASTVPSTSVSTSVPSSLGLSALTFADIPLFARDCGIIVSNWVDQMEFRFKASGLQKELWVSGILSRVDTHVWQEMRKHLVESDPLRTPYDSFILQFKEIY